ncbi:MAG TPA: hypothetical protein VE154_06865, partial [Chthoniobacterales bacterium]|nr:hypothetical protein [Chthoniobacterales bacterium]
RDSRENPYSVTKIYAKRRALLLENRLKWDACLACIAHKSLEICERCRLWKQNSQATPENLLRSSSYVATAKREGRAIAKRRRIPLIFGDTAIVITDL